MSTVERPLLTFALFAYNQEQYVAEAVQGALSQTYSPLEIILSDDCSSDGTFQIIKEMASKYKGPNRVIVRRNEHNLGLIGHINQVMKLVQGELIIAAAGDDISLPIRAQVLYDAYRGVGGAALSLYSKTDRIDEDGRRLQQQDNLQANSQYSLEYMANHHISVVGSAHAWHRKLFDIFGDIDESAVSEDVIIPFRAKLLGYVLAVNEVLVLRRHHKENIWLHPNGSDFVSMVKWQTSRFEQRINNLIGIQKTKLRDLESLESYDAEQSRLVQRLRPLVFKGAVEAEFEKTFFQMHTVQRLKLIVDGLQRGISVTRLARWLIQYSFPTLYYWLLRLRRPIIQYKSHQTK